MPISGAAVDAPVLEGGRIIAFKISPDGTKMALIRKTAGGSELGLARISRADKIMVDGWRTLNTTQSISPRITRMVDVAWIDPNDLLVLGAPSRDAAIAPFRVAEDASQISSEGESDDWDAVELTVLLRTQTAIILGAGPAGPGRTTAATGWPTSTRSRPWRTPADLSTDQRRGPAARRLLDGRLGPCGSSAGCPPPATCCSAPVATAAARPAGGSARAAGAGSPSCSRTRPRPDPCPAGFPTTVTSAPYDRLLRRLIIAHKERQALGLSRLLADRLAISVHGLLRLVGHRPPDP